MTQIETPRLQLKQICLKDAAFYLKLFNSEGWLKYIGDRNVHSIKDAEDYITKNYLSSYEKHGFGSFVVFLKGTDTAVGTCGLYKRENLEHPDIGFAFLPEYMGKGYGHEAASAVLDYAKQTLAVEVVLGFTVSYNEASIGLLEKIGLKEVGTYTFKDDPEELLLFSNE